MFKVRNTVYLPLSLVPTEDLLHEQVLEVFKDIRASSSHEFMTNTFVNFNGNFYTCEYEVNEHIEAYVEKMNTGSYLVFIGHTVK